jgi:hypothetical protein
MHSGWILGCLRAAWCGRRGRLPRALRPPHRCAPPHAWLIKKLPPPHSAGHHPCGREARRLNDEWP